MRLPKINVKTLAVALGARAAFALAGAVMAPAAGASTPTAADGGAPDEPARRALLAPEYQASVRPLCPHRSAKIFGPGGSRGIDARTMGRTEEG